MSSTSTQPTGYVCDTIPPAKLAKGSDSPYRSPSPAQPPLPPVTSFEALVPSARQLEESKDREGYAQVAPPPGRKLCVRHQRMADEGTNLKLQQARNSVRPDTHPNLL
ncbi:hypothetical protein BDW22DRAFT_1421922 [Trametopsis cervina]|nr:hypothetical protein BDW22DRAFT_1421922 [Trametopsis cervina]